MNPANLHVLTGAPGTGKTAVMRALDRTVRWVPEPAREILAEQRAVGGTATAQQDPARFVELLLQRSIEKYEAARSAGVPVLFDRGIPDCVAYAVVLDVDPATSVLAAREHRYDAEVLILEPWEEIYTLDDERTMSFEDTIPFGEALVEAYERTGYRLITVPRASAVDRAALVADFLRRSPTDRLPGSGTA